MQSSIEDLETFREEFQDKNSNEDAGSALSGIRTLMRSLDAFEYAFPELRDNIWFSGFQGDVHHAYWRVKDGKFDDALSSDEEVTRALAGEVNGILSNISESNNTNPISQLRRFLERYGEEFDPHNAPNEYQNEAFEARDLYCLGYFSTGLIVLGRAVERALLELGRSRMVISVNGFREHTSWEDARFFERTKALYEIDMPDKSGKILSKRQYHQTQLFVDYRNQVAHNKYRQISKETASRMMGQGLDLLSELEDLRMRLESLEDGQIQELKNVSVPI
ncbi:hypothetical protein [Natronomonas gomsonensis]|uniref:hypothetical protein n=1 Tax=Natronomonas gomsonensis TaxID=1046043 RepID=UPI0015C0B41A|nr:hypothetical protein [Natronomonas gomsonensis]